MEVVVEDVEDVEGDDCDGEVQSEHGVLVG